MDPGFRLRVGCLRDGGGCGREMHGRAFGDGAGSGISSEGGWLL